YVALEMPHLLAWSPHGLRDFLDKEIRRAPWGRVRQSGNPPEDLTVEVRPLYELTQLPEPLGLRARHRMLGCEFVDLGEQVESLLSLLPHVGSSGRVHLACSPACILGLQPFLLRVGQGKDLGSPTLETAQKRPRAREPFNPLGA